VEGCDVAFGSGYPHHAQTAIALSSEATKYEKMLGRRNARPADRRASRLSA
jgi:hypothetical protein